jgi:hypothetical protein
LSLNFGKLGVPKKVFLVLKNVVWVLIFQKMGGEWGGGDLGWGGGDERIGKGVYDSPISIRFIGMIIDQNKQE